MRMRFGSLFSGIGGMDLGLEWAGMECAWQVEIDPYCRSVLAHHWPAVPRFEDVTDERVQQAVHPVDLIVGGDPCQGNSTAGRGRSGSSGTTAFGDAFLAIVARVRPRLVLRENPYPCRRDSAWPWWVFAERLEGLGYAVLPFRIRACCVGADHQRDRVFLLGEVSDSERERVWGSGPGASARAAGGVQENREERQLVRSDAFDGDRGGADASDGHGGRCEVQRVTQPAGVEGARGGLADGRDLSRGVNEAAEDAAEPDSCGCGSQGGGLRERDAGGQRGRRPANGGAEGAADARYPNGVDEGEELRSQRCPGAESAGGGGIVTPEPAMGRGVHGFPCRLALDPVCESFPGRPAQIRGLGNAVVPQVAEWIGRAILTSDTPETNDD